MNKQKKPKIGQCTPMDAYKSKKKFMVYIEEEKQMYK